MSCDYLEKVRLVYDEIDPGDIPQFESMHPPLKAARMDYDPVFKPHYLPVAERPDALLELRELFNNAH